MLITVKTHHWQEQHVLSSRNTSMLEIAKLCATMGMRMIEEQRRPSLFGRALPQEGSKTLPPSPSFLQLP